MDNSLFTDHFGFKLPALVNFVGGGGKTRLILTLASEYSGRHPVLYTTTTRIHPPDVTDGVALVSCDDLNLLKQILARVGRHNFDHTVRFTLTRLEMKPGLLRGVPSNFCSNVDRESFPLILNEADGARGISLKMPRADEPVLMGGADYLVPVIGLDCLSKPLGPETIFRWETAAEKFSLKAGDRLTPVTAAALLLHRNGVCKDWHKGVRLVPYINKVDSEKDEPAARDLAHALIQNPNFPVERVVWGSLTHRRASSLAPSAQ